MRILVLAVLTAATLPQVAAGHYRPGTHNAVHAINQAWCGRADSHCEAAVEATAVARCESGPYWTWGRPAEAKNGQYLGMFQMGDWARSTYGHGRDPWSQARAAHRYWLASGWSGWQCTPWGYLRW